MSGGGEDELRRGSARRGAAERGELLAGRYELVACLGRGGSGEVWAARDRRLHRDVAVKVFGGLSLPSGGLPDWLRREGITAAQITHANVAVVHDQGADEAGRLYLVMELVTGASLHAVLRSGRLPVPDAVGVAAQVCEALAAAHAAGVVHRDVKPRNILVRADGTVKMVDFGIAGFLNDTRSWSAGRSADAVKGSGTPDYAAPEQILGKHADARSDLYSAGTLLFAMLAGQTPFPAENFLAVMHRKVTEDPPDVRQERPAVPEALGELVRALLARDPAERPGSAGEVAAKLREILSGLKSGEMSQPEVEVEGEAEVEVGPAEVALTRDDVVARAEIAGGGADAGPWRPLPEQAVSGPEPEPPIAAAVAAAATGDHAPSGGSEAEARPRPEGQRPAEDPVASTARPVWGAAEASPPDPVAASATRLSPVASPEIHGRSLLPAPPRSLLPQPTPARFVSPPGPSPAPLNTHETARRVLTWVTLGGLTVAAVVMVVLAVTRH